LITHHWVPTGKISLIGKHDVPVTLGGGGIKSFSQWSDNMLYSMGFWINLVPTFLFWKRFCQVSVEFILYYNWISLRVFWVYAVHFVSCVSYGYLTLRLKC